MTTEQYIQYGVTVIAAIIAVVMAYKRNKWVGVLREITHVIETTESSAIVKKEVKAYITSKSNKYLDTILKEEKND